MGASYTPDFLERTAGELVASQNREGAYNALRHAYRLKADAEAAIAILCKFLKIEVFDARKPGATVPLVRGENGEGIS